MILIEVNAIRRSGHHAFINWLISNLHGVKYQENLCKWKYNVITGNRNILWVNEGEQNIQNNIDYISTNPKKDITIISYEAPVKETLENPNYSILTDGLREKWGITEHIQIPFVRDFYNNFASLTKRPTFSHIFNEDEQNNEFSLFNRYLCLYKGQLKRASNTFRGVIYDKWISDEEYANEVCLKLIGQPNKFHPLEVGGTKSSYGDSKPNLDALFNRYKTVEWPKWVLDMVSEDEMLSEVISKAGFNKQDINK